MTLNIIYDRKKQAGKNGAGILELRITHARRTIYFSTGVRVRAKEWKAGRIVNRPDANELNKRVAVLYEKVCSIVNDCIRHGRPVRSDYIRREVWGLKEELSDDPVFLDWVEKQINSMPVVHGTKKQYRTLLRRLTEFDKMKRWSDVTAENICDFDSWLHQRHKKDGSFIIDSAVWKYHRSLKALLYRAVTFERLERNPYELLRGRFKHGDRENVDYLTESEMQAFTEMTVVGDKTMEISHDLFVFQLYTGLAYSDVQRFDFSQYRQIDGRWVHVGERIKTGVPYVSSLLPPAVKVLEKYDYQIPKIENHIYNRALKALGIMAGIQTPLHSHLARHTFATWMLRNGAKIENVSRMLGHTNIRQTQRYAKVVAQSVHEDFDRVAQKMKDKEP